MEINIWQATSRSQAWKHGCRGLLKRFTTPSGCTQRSATAQPANSNPNSLSRWL